jgi:hypothetical protein
MIHDVARFARRVCGEGLWPEASDNMSKAIKKAPSSHRPSAIMEGARTQSADDSLESFNDLEVSACHDEQADGKFSQELWSRQVFEDRTLISSQKLILLVLSHFFDEDGKCDVNNKIIAERTSTSTKLIRDHSPILEELGWYQRKRKRYSIEYLALRGRKSEQEGI